MGLRYQHAGSRQSRTYAHGHAGRLPRAPQPPSNTPGDRLIYSPNGLLVARSDAGYWVVPPTTVLRLAPAVAYSVRKADAVQVRTFTLSAALSRRLPDESGLYRMTPLLRELLESLSPLSDEPLNDSKSSLLVELLNDVGMWSQDSVPTADATPADPRVAHICAYVRTNLDSPKTLQEWAAELNNDTRTLHRLFVQEFGMPFVQWRQQTRLMAALEWLADGRPVMDVALDLGYQTQSAFTAMFRRKIGITPTEWQEKRRPVCCWL